MDAEAECIAPSRGCSSKSTGIVMGLGGPDIHHFILTAPQLSATNPASFSLLFAGWVSAESSQFDG
jgi:hypothetical protein